MVLLFPIGAEQLEEKGFFEEQVDGSQSRGTVLNGMRNFSNEIAPLLCSNQDRKGGLVVYSKPRFFFL